MEKETYLVQTNNEKGLFEIVSGSAKAKELSEYLIEAFTPLSSRDRQLLSNNAFMVGTQLTIVLGKEKYEEIKMKFGEMDWRIAWHLFDNHFNQTELDF